MATKALKNRGITLKMGDGASPENFTTIAEVYNIDGWSLERDMIDATSFDSGDDREYIGGIRDVGEMNASVHLVPDDPTHNAATGFLRAYLDGVAKNLRVVWPNGALTSWTAKSLVKAIKPSGEVGGKLISALSFKGTGGITIV